MKPCRRVYWQNQLRASAPQTSDMTVRELCSFRISREPDKDKNSSCDSLCSMMTLLAERRTAPSGQVPLPSATRRAWVSVTREGMVSSLSLSVTVKKFTAAMRHVENSGHLCSLFCGFQKRRREKQKFKKLYGLHLILVIHTVLISWFPLIAAPAAPVDSLSRSDKACNKAVASGSC